MRTINTATRLKSVVKPVKPTLTDNLALNIAKVTSYRRAIRRYYQARLSYGDNYDN